MRRATPRVAGTDPDDLPDPDRDPIVLLEAREGEEAVLRLLRDHLDPTEQEAIWLRCFERMPVEDITRVLAVSERSGARAVLQRARRKLRQALESKTRMEGGHSGE
jgi:DNA-directed RNA polymerase specialized sigma24 family protein